MTSEKDDPLHVTNEKLEAARNYAQTLDRSQWLALFRLVTDALYRIRGTDSEWEPFLAALEHAGLNRGERNDLLALHAALMQRSTRPEPALRRDEDGPA